MKTYKDLVAKNTKEGLIACPDPQCTRLGLINTEPIFTSHFHYTDKRKNQYVCMCGYKTKKKRNRGKVIAQLAKDRRMLQNG